MKKFFFFFITFCIFLSACTQTDYDRDLKIAQKIHKQDPANRNLNIATIGDKQLIHVYSENMDQPATKHTRISLCGVPNIEYFYELYEKSDGSKSDITKTEEPHPYTSCGTGCINVNGRRYRCEIGYLTKNDYLSKEERDAGMCQHWLVITVKNRNAQITFREVIDFGCRIDACSAEVEDGNIRVFSRGVFEFPAHTPKSELADSIARIVSRKTGYISN